VVRGQILLPIGRGRHFHDRVSREARRIPVSSQTVGHSDGRRGRGRMASLELLLRYAAPYRVRLLVLGGLLLVSATLQVVTPLLIMEYIDDAYGTTTVKVLSLIAVTYIILAILQQATLIAATALEQGAAWSMTNEMRTDLTAYCLDLDYAFHREHSPGELIERIDGDVFALSNFLSSAFLILLTNSIVITGIIVATFVISWQIGAILAAYGLVAIVVLTRLRNFALAPYDRVRETSASLFGFLEERLRGIEDIRSAGAEQVVIDQMTDHGLELMRRQRSARVREVLLFVITHGLYLIGYGSALAVAAFLYYRHEVTLGTTYLVVSYANAIYLPLNTIRTQAQDLQLARASLARIVSLFSTTRSVVDGRGVSVPDGPVAVEFEDVSFAYEEAAVLRGVSFSLAPGHILGVVGRTGSGKTTIGRLAARMYDPSAGRVRLGGVDLHDTTSAQLRERIGIVPQEVQLFPGSVRDNLTLYDKQVPDTAVLDAIERFALADWLASLPDGLDTMLDGADDGMSAGQSQLLAACRVFLHDPGLVILDEISSRLDSATEARIDAALSELVRNRTAIVIAHRRRTIERADDVLVIDDGRVLEYGPRSVLDIDPTAYLPAQESTV
jgi:ATP-binding cassette subfamily B protein